MSGEDMWGTGNGIQLKRDKRSHQGEVKRGPMMTAVPQEWKAASQRGL